MKKAWAFLERNALWVRVILSGAAIVLLIRGWVIGPAVSPEGWKWLHDNYPSLQRFAAVPATVWGASEAVRDVVKKRRGTRDEDFRQEADEILVEAEDECAKQGIASRTYHCGVTVWRVGELSEEDRARGENRRPLVRAASRPMRYRRSTSGLKWRETMGVIGISVAQNQTLAVDVSVDWKPLVGATRETWAAAEEGVRQGLTFDEFSRAVSASSSGLPKAAAGPFILAVPIWHGQRPVGVAAIDTPPEMGPAILDSKVADLLYALGDMVLSGR